jgi:hypothetical protein
MNEQSSQDSEGVSKSSQESQDRREFLGSLGKWSSASVMAAVGTAAWLATSGDAHAGWINRRGGWLNGRGGWVNGGGGGGSWVNRRGGGGWINRR